MNSMMGNDSSRLADTSTAPEKPYSYPYATLEMQEHDFGRSTRMMNSSSLPATTSRKTV